MLAVDQGNLRDHIYGGVQGLMNGQVWEHE